MNEEDFRELYNKIKKMKNDLLMEEPCPLYDFDEWDLNDDENNV